MKKFLFSFAVVMAILPKVFAQTPIPAIVVIDKAARDEFRGSEWETTEGLVRDMIIPAVNKALAKHVTIKVSHTYKLVDGGPTTAPATDGEAIPQTVITASDIGFSIVPPQDGVLIIVMSDKNRKRDEAKIRRGYVALNFADGKTYSTETEEAKAAASRLTDDLVTFLDVKARAKKTGK